jgi:hypothetical protein
MGLGVSSSDEQETTEKPSRAIDRRTVWLITAVSVAVLMVAGVVVYLLTSGDDSSAEPGPDVPSISASGAAEPTTSSQASSAPPANTATGAVAGAEPEAAQAQTVAEDAATAISNADVAALTKLSCDPASVGTEDQFPADAKAEVAGPPKITGDTATVDLTLTIAGSEPATVPMPLTKKDGRWCIP